MTKPPSPIATFGDRPAEFMSSVDLALRIIVLLRDDGHVAVSAAAELMDVSASRVHRTLQMLVYRGFATRNESHGYLPGPALFATSLPEGRGAVLIEAAAPYLEAIARETTETAHVVTFSGSNTHFLFSVESSRSLRCSGRRGQVIPSTKNAGGLVFLSTLSGAELHGLYPTMDTADMEELRRELHTFRNQGFAVNRGLFEADIRAVSALVVNDLGDPLGALSIAIPSSRFGGEVDHCVRVLRHHVRDLNRAVRLIRNIDL